ncbi:MAG: stage II sporulation protein D [Bacillota bacterium]
MSWKTGYLMLVVFLILIVLPFLLIKGLPFSSREAPEKPVIIRVYNHNNQRTLSLELEEYLQGVVAAEMPALYHPEALKAQAIAARTYTIKQLTGAEGKPQHTGADLCTDYRCCQAWLSTEDLKQKWGFMPFFYYWSRINRAVAETRGEILCFQGQPIDAVYHSNSGGRTEDARYVWGRSLPYLQSVVSPYDRERQKNYTHELTLPVARFDRLLGSDLEGIINRYKQNDTGDYRLTTGSNDPLFQVLKKTPGQRVLSLKIGQQEFTGLTLRQKLSLPSSNFRLSLAGDQVKVRVRGNGHGVGMSQDGADGFGRHDYGYREILAHYYPGTELKEISELSNQ